MPAYLVGYEQDMRDRDSLNEYGRRAYPTLAAHGARFLASASPSSYEVLEGEWRPELVAVVEFPSLDAARAWYSSPEYEAAKPFRQRASRSNMLLLDGR